MYSVEKHKKYFESRNNIEMDTECEVSENLNRFNWLFPFMYIPKGYDKNLCLSHLKDIFNRYEIKILNKKVLCQFK